MAHTSCWSWLMHQVWQVLQAQQKAGAEGLTSMDQLDDVTGSSDPESRGIGRGPTKTPDTEAAGSIDAEVGHVNRCLVNADHTNDVSVCSAGQTYLVAVKQHVACVQRMPGLGRCGEACQPPLWVPEPDHEPGLQVDLESAPGEDLAPEVMDAPSGKPCMRMTAPGPSPEASHPAAHPPPPDLTSTATGRSSASRSSTSRPSRPSAEPGSRQPGQHRGLGQKLDRRAVQKLQAELRSRASGGGAETRPGQRPQDLSSPRLPHELPLDRIAAEVQVGLDGGMSADPGVLHQAGEDCFWPAQV